MPSFTAAAHRAAGGTYPDWSKRDFTAYPGHVTGEVAPHVELPLLMRMPSPAVIYDMLANDGRFSLQGEGLDAAYVAELDTFYDFAWSELFGGIALLDPWALSPWATDAEGVYIVDARQPLDPDTTVYVPDQECAARILGCRSWAEAEPRLPQDYWARLEDRLMDVVDYLDEVALLERLEGWITRDEIDDDVPDLSAWREGQPLYDQPLARRLSWREKAHVFEAKHG